MKILLIHDIVDKEYGGAEVIFHKHEKFLKDNGHEVAVLGGGSHKTIDNFIYQYSRGNIKICRMINAILTDYLEAKQMRKWIKTFQPDIIHIHNIKYRTFTILRAIKGYKTLLTAHDFGYVYPNTSGLDNDNNILPNPFKMHHFFKMNTGAFNRFTSIFISIYFFKLKKRLQKQVNMIIAPSKALQKAMKKSGYTNLVTINNNIERIDAYDIYEEKDIDFLFVGRIESVKGREYLVNTFNKINKGNIFLVGDGPEINKLDKYKKLNKNIKVVGRDNPHKYYPRAKALIVPSLGLENYPTVILEGMQYNMMIIGSNRGGIPELLSNYSNGCLFTIGDRSLEELMTAVAKNEIQTKIRSQNKQENMFTKYLRIYEN